jgi:stage V sporulation protein R
MAPGRLNPYKIGIELFREIETAGTRASSARTLTSATTSRRSGAGTATGHGRQKIFEVRKIYNDLTFIDLS